MFYFFRTNLPNLTKNNKAKSMCLTKISTKYQANWMLFIIFIVRHTYIQTPKTFCFSTVSLNWHFGKKLIWNHWFKRKTSECTWCNDFAHLKEINATRLEIFIVKRKGILLDNNQLILLIMLHERSTFYKKVNF